MDFVNSGQQSPLSNNCSWNQKPPVPSSDYQQNTTMRLGISAPKPSGVPAACCCYHNLWFRSLKTINKKPFTEVLVQSFYLVVVRLFSSKLVGLILKIFYSPNQRNCRFWGLESIYSEITVVFRKLSKLTRFSIVT